MERGGMLKINYFHPFPLKFLSNGLLIPQTLQLGTCLEEELKLEKKQLFSGVWPKRI